MSLFDELVAATADERAAFAQVPQIRDALAGRISREAYIAYLAQAYGHVSHTVPLMQLTKSRLDDAHAHFRDALDTYIAEETGHEHWILNDIRAAGGDPAAVVAEGPNAATETMVAFAYDFITRKAPMGFFGMVFVLEGVSTQLASAGASAVQASLGLPPAAFTYLTSHGALDISHMAFLKGLLDSVEDPADRAAVVHMAKRMFGLFADVFRSIPNTPQTAEAVSHAL